MIDKFLIVSTAALTLMLTACLGIVFAGLAWPHQAVNVPGMIVGLSFFCFTVYGAVTCAAECWPKK